MSTADPDRGQWASLRPRLTHGELYVGDLLVVGLPEPWELYVQPHLNGLRPDFVLMHPDRGIIVLEVKDWADEEKHPKQILSALGKVDQYGRETRDLYAPSLGRRHSSHVSSHLVLPYQRHDTLLANLSKAGARSSSQVFHADVSGPALLEALDGVLPPPSAHAREAHRDLRHWLLEPEFSAEQRSPLDVDPRQRDLIRSRTASGLRRIRGSAGSGKSLVLAARAAELARSGQEVLVVTFNITLLNYLRDLAVRWPTPQESTRPIRERVTWLNFHQWCKRVCRFSHRSREYGRLWSGAHEDALEEGVAALTGEVLSEGSEFAGRYDAVLVDEGQDCRPDWWDTLRLSVKPGGEMLLVADASQDLYSHARAWTDEAMLGAGFSGPWVELRRSYRLPRRVAELAARFLENFGEADLAFPPEPVQAELDLGETHLSWTNVPPGGDVVAICVDELLTQLDRMANLGVPELVFLASTKTVGAEVAAALEAKGIRVQHTFQKDDAAGRGMKRAFFKGAARVKATTLHSFKGWESRAVVMHVGRRWGSEAMATAYAGLTRVRRSDRGSILSVVNELAELRSFGEQWNSG